MNWPFDTCVVATCSQEHNLKHSQIQCFGDWVPQALGTMGIACGVLRISRSSSSEIVYDRHSPFSLFQDSQESLTWMYSTTKYFLPPITGINLIPKRRDFITGTYRIHQKMVFQACCLHISKVNNIWRNF